MGNLFWRAKSGTTALLDTPFRSEDEFERKVFASAELLEDIFLLKRQVRGGGKTGIPDIVGIDADGSICIIEMKNCPVDAAIIPQVLQYAFWAETNPDSVKSLWLECDGRPEDISINWDDVQVRILIVAPKVLRSTLHLIDKINYPVDLIEINRWVQGDNEFLLVDKLEPEPRQKTRPASGHRVYDEAFYKEERNRKSVDTFLRYARDLETLVKKQGWNLELKFNRQYCGFKAGFFNVFGIGWWGTKSFGFFVKISEAEAKRLKPAPCSYNTRWKMASYPIEPGTTKVSDLLPVFEFAYNKFTGKQSK